MKLTLFTAAVAAGVVAIASLAFWWGWSEKADRAPGVVGADTLNSVPIASSADRPGTARGGSAESPVAQLPLPRNNIGWVEKLSDATDLFSFVGDALPLALSGDGNARFFVGQAVQACSGTALLYRKFADPSARFEALQRDDDGSIEAVAARDLVRAQFERCKRFIHEDAFAHLPSREGGYPASYWFDLALESGSSLAKIQRAGEHLRADGTMVSGPGISAETQRAISDLRESLLTGDPVAINSVAYAIAFPAISGGSNTPIALMILACQQGLDCSTSASPEAGACLGFGVCADGETTIDRIKRDLGMEHYAEAYAKAQQFLDAIERQDEEAVSALLQLRGPPRGPIGLAAPARVRLWPSALSPEPQALRSSRQR